MDTILSENSIRSLPRDSQKTARKMMKVMRATRSPERMMKLERSRIEQTNKQTNTERDSIFCQHSTTTLRESATGTAGIQRRPTGKYLG